MSTPFILDYKKTVLTCRHPPVEQHVGKRISKSYKARANSSVDDAWSGLSANTHGMQSWSRFLGLL